MSTRFYHTFEGKRAEITRGIPAAAYHAAPLDQRDEPEIAFSTRKRSMYTRRYRRRRFRRSFKRPWGRKYYGRRPNAGRIALRKVRQLERDREVKRIGNSDSIAIPAGGAGQMEGIGPYLGKGTDINDRLADKITLKSVSLKVSLKQTALEALGNSVRIMLVMDRKPAGALPAGVTTVLGTDDILSHYNTEGASKGRFQFLFDRTISFDSEQGEWHDKWFMARDIKVLYSTDAGTIADVQRNNFFILALADNNTQGINLYWNVMFKFYDD